MSLLYNCAICCMMLSAWGLVQLMIMGIFYQVETTLLLEDVIADDYVDYDDLIKKTKENFAAVAINCWIAAAIYVLLLGISFMCFRKAKATAKKAAEKLEDDELSCMPDRMKEK